MNYSLKIKLLELTQRALMVRADAQPDNGDKWRTTETGSKILLGKDGTVKGGMGGKFNGLHISEVKKKSEEESHGSLTNKAISKTKAKATEKGRIESGYNKDLEKYKENKEEIKQYWKNRDNAKKKHLNAIEEYKDKLKDYQALSAAEKRKKDKWGLKLHQKPDYPQMESAPREIKKPNIREYFEETDNEFNVNTQHETSSADLFSERGAAKTTHEFEGADHAENYLESIDNKLTSSGYQKKETGGAVTYTKGNHVFNVSHNLDDEDNEDNYNDDGDFIGKVSVKSGYLDSSLQGAEPISKQPTEPAKPVEVENKTLNSLTKQNESNKISSPSQNEDGQSGENKMNVNIDSNKKILQSAIARHKKEYDLITHALTNSEWFKETKKEAGESNGASAADARQTVASASVSQKKLIETMEKAGIDMPEKVKYLGVKDQPKVEEYNKKVYDAITKVASDFIKNNKDESKALAVKNSNSFADALAIMAKQQPEKTENATPPTPPTPPTPVAKKGNRAAVLTTGADAGKIQVEYGYNSKMYDELKKLKGAKYIKSGIFYVPSVHAKEVIELSKKHGLGLSDGFKESFSELVQDFEPAKPVEAEKKTSNSLTKDNKSNKISSPSQNEAGKSGDIK